MTMQATSLIAYEQLRDSLGKKEAMVFNSISQCVCPVTNSELAQHLGWSINRVTGRTNRLVEKGLVKEHCKRPCTITGHTAIAWRIRRPDEIEHQEDFFRG